MLFEKHDANATVNDATRSEERVRYDTRCYYNTKIYNTKFVKRHVAVASDTSRLNLPHATNKLKSVKQKN